MTPSDVELLLESLIAVSRASAEILFKEFDSKKEIVLDLPRDVKLEADLFLDAFIRDRLEEETGFPVISEENPQSHFLSKGYQIIVDPLDGSLNFSHGIPFSCISIALWEGLNPLIGVVYDFNRKEMFSGLASEDGYLDGKSMKTSSVKDKNDAILATGFPTGTDFSQNALLGFVEDIRQYKKVRLFGSAALSLSYVACGRVDCYRENGIKIWDVAAGLALVKSTGGKIQYALADDGISLNVFASNPYLV